MADRLLHRGSNDSGTWVDAEVRLALGHRRFSILDLSPARNQPAKSVSSRYVIIFNGEVYNHLELRSELGAISWRGHSDIETLLAAIETWGLNRTLLRLVSMFAFAL